MVCQCALGTQASHTLQPCGNCALCCTCGLVCVAHKHRTPCSPVGTVPSAARVTWQVSHTSVARPVALWALKAASSKGTLDGLILLCLLVELPIVCGAQASLQQQGHFVPDRFWTCAGVGAGGCSCFCTCLHPFLFQLTSTVPTLSSVQPGMLCTHALPACIRPALRAILSLRVQPVPFATLGGGGDAVPRPKASSFPYLMS
eukprot:1161640-Pelagomonas_calceolata.AAC.2